jgi:predicted dithiol-disulfide oxidoreductase (DUF899 family)
MSLPEIVDQDDWFAQRKRFLDREKEITRQIDRLNAERRRLPMVRVGKEYRFTGPEGEVGLVDLFGNHRQLVVQHFMFDPSWDSGCASCSAMSGSAANPAVVDQLGSRGTAFAAVSRAPLATIETYREQQGWTFPWYSSHGGDFNFDYHVSFDPDVAPAMFNFRDAGELAAAGMDWVTGYRGEQPGISCFLRDGAELFHTYSTYGRGVEVMMPAYHLLDLTPLGRQEVWEQPAGRADVLYRSDRSALSRDLVTG